MGHQGCENNQNLEAIMVETICKGREINWFTCRPYGNIEKSSWRPLCTLQKTRGLMHLLDCVHIFYEVLFGFICSWFVSFGLYLLNWFILLHGDDVGGDDSFGPWHPSSFPTYFMFFIVWLQLRFNNYRDKYLLPLYSKW